MKFFSLIIIAFLLFSCDSKKPSISGSATPSGAAAGAGTLEIFPKEATRKTTLKLSSTGFDLAEGTVEWFINDNPFTTDVPDELNCEDAGKGDIVRARIVIGEDIIQSDAVEIKNSLPEITGMKLLPEIFKPGDTLSIDSTASDFDDDPVSFEYVWTKNGEPAGDGENIQVAVKRGDKIVVTVTPYDGTDYGKPAVIRTEIRNMPPIIIDHAQFSMDAPVYTYQIKASDPDGDRLTYAIQSPEEGMTIGPSGLVRWKVPSEFTGVKAITVIVTDGNGGSANYDIAVTIGQI